MRILCLFSIISPDGGWLGPGTENKKFSKSQGQPEIKAVKINLEKNLGSANISLFVKLRWEVGGLRR